MILTGDEPIFIHRRVATGVNDHGNTIFETREILVRNCLVAFGSTSEPVLVDGKPVDSALTIYFPPETNIVDGDEFEIRNQRWVKDGDPLNWQSPWPDFSPGVVVNVRRRRG